MKEKENTLDRSLNPMNVLSLAVGCIIGWGAFVMPGNLFLKTAGPLGTAIGMTIGAVIMIIIAMNYGYMIKKIPVAGGEFAYTFKVFGRKHAFLCAWFLGLSYLSIVPLNATALGLIGRYMFPGLLQRGYLYTISGWEVYFGEVVFASAALVIFAITSVTGIKTSGRLQTILAISLVGSIVILTIVAFMNPETRAVNLLPLYAPEVPPLKGILAVVAIAPWAYVGFDAIPQASEEFNFSPKKARGIMIFSIIFGGLMYIALNTITAIVFPWTDFIGSEPFWATGTAVEHLMGTAGLAILGLALAAAILAGVIGFYMASSRLLLSMSRAKALPAWFGVIHPKYKTPVNAIKFVLLISLAAPWFGRQVLLWVVDMASIGAAIGYLYTSSSAFRLVIKEKGLVGLKISSGLGSLFSLGFIVLLIVPGMPAYLSFPSRIALMVWCGLGGIFYLASAKNYHKLPEAEMNKLIMNE